jgi:hypothetical protein
MPPFQKKQGAHKATILANTKLPSSGIDAPSQPTKKKKINSTSRFCVEP